MEIMIATCLGVLAGIPAALLVFATSPGRRDDDEEDDGESPVIDGEFTVEGVVRELDAALARRPAAVIYPNDWM